MFKLICYKIILPIYLCNYLYEYITFSLTILCLCALVPLRPRTALPLSSKKSTPNCNASLNSFYIKKIVKIKINIL